jgi:hypothetical protein
MSAVLANTDSPNTNRVLDNVPVLTSARSLFNRFKLPTAGVARGVPGGRPGASVPKKLAQVSPGTGGGQAVVEQFAQPTTVIGGGTKVKGGFISPPSATGAVMQALQNSNPLAENTVTGSGTGNLTQSLPVSKRVLTTSAYVWIAALGAALLVGFAWDRGKL